MNENTFFSLSADTLQGTLTNDATVQGVFADAVGSWQWTWTIALVCELVMLYYALWGCRIKDAECMD